MLQVRSTLEKPEILHKLGCHKDECRKVVCVFCTDYDALEWRRDVNSFVVRPGHYCRRNYLKKICLAIDTTSQLKKITSVHQRNINYQKTGKPCSFSKWCGYLYCSRRVDTVQCLSCTGTQCNTKGTPDTGQHIAMLNHLLFSLTTKQSEDQRCTYLRSSSLTSWQRTSHCSSSPATTGSRQ